MSGSGARVGDRGAVSRADRLRVRSALAWGEKVGVGRAPFVRQAGSLPMVDKEYGALARITVAAERELNLHKEG